MEEGVIRRSLGRIISVMILAFVKTNLWAFKTENVDTTFFWYAILLYSARLFCGIGVRESGFSSFIFDSLRRSSSSVLYQLQFIVLFRINAAVYRGNRFSFVALSSVFHRTDY